MTDSWTIKCRKCGFDYIQYQYTGFLCRSCYLDELERIRKLDHD